MSNVMRIGLGIRACVVMVACLAGIGSASAQDVAATKSGDPKVGDDVFIKCSGCHQVGPGAVNGIGPELNGVVGRHAAAVAGYDYSPALKDANIAWNHDALAAFVTDAKRLVPGTRMSFAGLKSRQDVEDLIAYLAQFDGEGKAR